MGVLKGGAGGLGGLKGGAGDWWAKVGLGGWVC